jgi:hypothetical protein
VRGTKVTAFISSRRFELGTQETASLSSRIVDGGNQERVSLSSKSVNVGTQKTAYLSSKIRGLHSRNSLPLLNNGPQWNSRNRLPVQGKIRRRRRKAASHSGRSFVGGTQEKAFLSLRRVERRTQDREVVLWVSPSTILYDKEAVSRVPPCSSRGQGGSFLNDTIENPRGEGGNFLGAT